MAVSTKVLIPAKTAENAQTTQYTATNVTTIIDKSISHSVFLWGPPGIGKSSIVRKVADDKDLQLIDLRISQLAPTDLRGLPFVEDGFAKFAPPSFLPQEGEGILFVDEFNMASPSMMGIAQQLILDRQRLRVNTEGVNPQSKKSPSWEGLGVGNR